MRSPLDKMTPGQIARVAAIVAFATSVSLGYGYVSDQLTPTLGGLGGFLLSSSLLLAAPRQRASELLGAITVWMCFAEFLSTMQSGQFAMWRLAVSVATLGCVMSVIRVQHLRDLNRRAPDTILADLDRRTAGGISVLPRTDAQLAALRSEDAQGA